MISNFISEHEKEKTRIRGNEFLLKICLEVLMEALKCPSSMRLRRATGVKSIGDEWVRGRRAVLSRLQAHHQSANFNH